ncbi:T9SS type A sorting domain-containing protein [Brumimicrobium oceani]|uniref:Secretion system C-terminal sorting domain-containing protein n=1 Tax=Brumimicrobium oceani TaxID=2100725 RepID=A0A2U2XBE9_9FLAO|nr:T9SS type A sorting domain-containing protein [Brumimicrobium oceani]PWH85125.1 hypothetical protein DIT68_10845 [Brumimicrobium oceani]
MKLLKLSLLAFSTFICQTIISQNASTFLDYNNVRLLINERGSLFNNSQVNSPGYETPINGGNHLIYQGAFWFGGTNQNGDLKLAAHLYGSDYDYYAGPYSTTGDYMTSAYVNTYTNGPSFWTISRVEIINHINNVGQSGYTIPQNILNWPGNGDTTVGVAQQLAPYVDVDSNGVYEPQLGDYPCLKGDVAVYQIFHEDMTHAESGGGKIGAEIHLMAYQYADNTYLNNTTFIETTVYNRGQNSFSDFKASFFLDTDIGFSEDDYIGSAPSSNLVYSYNGDDFDEGGGGAPGYGTNPPAVGVVSLNRDIEYSGTFNRADLGIPQTTEPSSAMDFWNYMNGKWKDNSSWTYGGTAYGGTTPVQHLFDGNPNTGVGWSEVNTDGNGSVNQPKDRKIVMTSIEESFQTGDKLVYNYAIITNRDGDNLQNVDGLIATANSVQQFFDTTNTYCLPNGTLGLSDELEIGKLEIYPNPAANQIQLVWEDMNVDKIEINSYNGKLAKTIYVEDVNGEKAIDISELSSGVYFVNIGRYTRKLIVK